MWTLTFNFAYLNAARGLIKIYSLCYEQLWNTTLLIKKEESVHRASISDQTWLITRIFFTARAECTVIWPHWNTNGHRSFFRVTTWNGSVHKSCKSRIIGIDFPFVRPIIIFARNEHRADRSQSRQQARFSLRLFTGASQIYRRNRK
jgi:hypothetical protein